MQMETSFWGTIQLPNSCWPWILIADIWFNPKFCLWTAFFPHYEPRFLQIIVHTICQLPNYLSNLRRWLHSRVHLPVYPPHLLCNSHNRAKCLLLSQHNADICFNPKLSLKTAFFTVFVPCHGMATCSFSHFKPWFLQWKWWLPCTLPPLVIQKCTWPDSTCDSYNLKTGLNFDCWHLVFWILIADCRLVLSYLLCIYSIPSYVLWFKSAPV